MHMAVRDGERTGIDSRQSGEPGERGPYAVLRTFSQQELRAYRWLACSGFHPFLPTFRKNVPQNFHARRNVVRMMFPSYQFLPVNEIEHVWRMREACPVTVSLLMVCGRPGVLPDEAVAAIRYKEAELAEELKARPRGFDGRVGDKVVIEEGVFAGFCGVIEGIERLDDHGRIRVALDIFRRLTPSEVSVDQVRLV